MRISAIFPRCGAGWIAWGAAACGLLMQVSPAPAAPLDKTLCAKLAQEMQNMKALDVDRLMEKGPAWAAAHLSPGDLSLVRQYIDLDEQMKFRCAAPGALVHLKHLEDEDEENGAKPAEDAAGARDRSESAPAKPKPKAAKAKRPAEANSAGSR